MSIEFPGVFDRAALEIFAAFVKQHNQEAPPGRAVANLGTGAGHVTAYLNWMGVESYGLDATQEQVTQARQEYPKILFDVGNHLPLDIADGVLGGLVSWYSLTELDELSLGVAFSEFNRVLDFGGLLLFAFSVRHGDGSITLKGNETAERSIRLLQGTQFTLENQMVYEAQSGELARNVLLLARKTRGGITAFTNSNFEV